MTDIPEDVLELAREHSARWANGSEGSARMIAAALIADRAAQAERMARLEEALRNLAHEMRFLLRNKPRMDGGLYRQRLSEADAALAEFGACKHNCDVGGICLAEHAGFPESCARALSQEGSDA